MTLYQRLGLVTDEEYADRWLSLTKDFPGAMDGVWVQTAYGYPPLEAHREYARLLGVATEKFRRAGVRVSLQISNTVGHGLYVSARDCSGLVYEGSPAEKMVGHDGTVAEYAFCYRGKHFRKYILDSLRYYLPIHPDRVWIDDDCRTHNHAPVRYGCFCPDCIAAFNAEAGTDYDREGLVAEILKGGAAREAWREFTRRSMAEFVSSIVSLVHELSPSSAMGHQHGAYGAYSGRDFVHITTPMFEGTGLFVASRPGGGAYSDRDPVAIPDKCLEVMLQNALQPPFVTEIAPEVENTPDVAFGKTPAGTAFETSLYFAAGATDMSYAMMGVPNEPFEFHREELALFTARRPYWERLARMNRETKLGGLRYLLPEASWRERGAVRDVDALEKRYYKEIFHLWRDAVPFTFSEGEGAGVLCPDEARGFSRAEIGELLSKNVITDGETLAILREKGIDLGIRAEALVEGEKLRRQETFTDHPLNGGELTSYGASLWAAGRSEAYYLLPEGDTDAEILGYYTSQTEKPVFEGDYPFGVSSLLLRTKEGGTWAILGYYPWRGVIPSALRNRFLRIANALSPLAAYPTTRHPALFLPRLDQEGRVRAVSVANTAVGTAHGFGLVITRPQGERFTFLGQGGEEIPLLPERTEAGFSLTLPDLPAFTVGTVFCD